MATVVENEKGFKILKLSQRESARAGMGIWYRNEKNTEDLHECICMSCNDIIEKRIYYIAVLNDCMCKKCFEKWYQSAENYPEDRKVEQRNFDFYYNKVNGTSK